MNEIARINAGYPDWVPDAGVGQPSQPSGSATQITLLHDCQYRSFLRFLTARPDPDLLNVREYDEDAGALADNRPFVAPSSDGGGIGTAPVCGDEPERPVLLGNPIHYVAKR